MPASGRTPASPLRHFGTPGLRHLPATALMLFLAMPADTLRADPIRFMRDPHVAGNSLVFSYHGDIWLTAIDGSSPRRLTTHPAREVAPRFSPDGRWVAFSSDRMGNYDVFVVSVDGGEARQLTWHTGDDLVQYWTPDGTGILISTARAAHPFGSPLYVVPVDGGIPVPLDIDFGRAGMISPDGAMLAFNRNAMSTTRKGYRGNNSTDVWVQDLRSREIRRLTDTDLQRFREFTQDGMPMWGADGRIYFASERGGTFNLWRIAAGGGEPEPFTDHEIGGVKYPAASPDGRTIVYTNDHELWAVDVPDGTPRRISVDLSFDPSDSRTEYIAVENRAEGWALSPDAKHVAVDARGEILLVPVDPTTGEMRRITRSPWRERFQRYSPDGKQLAWVSDESGEEEIWVMDLGSGERRRITDHASFKTPFIWAPDSRRIAWVGANRLFEVDVPSGRSAELAYNIAGGYTLGEYSPDGGWLAYTRSDEDQNADVYLLEIDSRREVNVSDNPFRESNPRLAADGRTLVFTSTRDGGINHLFAVSLTRLAADPADPLVRGARTEPGDSAAPQPLRVDAEGIDRRAIRITSGDNGASGPFLSADGTTVYYNSRDDEGPALFGVPLVGGERRRVAPGAFSDPVLSADGRTVFYAGPAASGAVEIHRLTLANARKERVDFAFTVEVDRAAEWRQIFEESWRVMKYRFYDEKMHGVDWNAMREQYRPLLQHVGTYEDAHDLANQMIGELNASHVGVSGPTGRAAPTTYQARFPGFELEPSDGRYRISHIYRDGPADREWLGLKEGDYVLAIDGQELRAGDNYWRTLNHALNEFVPVRVAGSVDGSGARDVRIRTVTSLSDVRYEDWVARNREFVDRESGGRVAYVHIRAMNQPSLQRFQNEIDRYWNAESIVVDIRYNGGGNIDQQLIDILEREPYQFWNSRWGARTWGRRPRQAIAGPKVMLINHRSGSDSEVTPTAFRQLGLGRIVGNPTAAAVIATGSYRLIHGGSIRTPGSLVVTWDPTRPDNYGYNLENFGVPPDVWVENTPEDHLRGFDRELKTAIDEALRMLGEKTWRYTTEQQQSGTSGSRE